MEASQSKAKVSLTFSVYQGETLARKETITQDIIKIGTDPKSPLKVDDKLASRMHATIEIVSIDDITLIDLGNEPRTKVNGAEVNKCKIKPGDVIEIGTSKFKFEGAAPAGAQAAAPAQDNPFAAANPFGGGSSSPFGGGSSGSNPFGGGDANPFGAANPFASPFGGGVFGSNNPFAPAQPQQTKKADIFEVPDDAPEGTYTYQMLKSGPDLNPDEVEQRSKPCVEVMILWGTTVLHTAHLDPPRNYYVGEQSDKVTRCEFLVPQEKLGSTRAPLVLVNGTKTYAVLLPKAKGTIEIPGQDKMSLDEAIQTAKAQPCPSLNGAHQIELTAGARVKLEMGDMVFQLASVAAGKRIPPAVFAASSFTALLFIGMSFLVHGGLLAGMAFFKPSLSSVDDEESRQEQRVLMQQILKAAAAREEEQKPPEQDNSQQTKDKEGGTGTKAKGSEGTMGKDTSKDKNKHYAIAGNADNPQIARQAAIKEAREFGIIGLLNASQGGSEGPTAAWGADVAIGKDAITASGNMWGAEAGEAFGSGGLGLAGVGDGGGGTGEGIGLGTIGTIGRGRGTGSGQGIGSGKGGISGEHKAKPPKISMGTSTVSGKLPPEVIQRIVRQNFGRFRLCYENGLRNNPSLSGRVSVRFVISTTGGVSSASNGGSDLADSSVVSCVVRAFQGLSFPAPEGGVVTVVYPISFAPGG